MKQGKKSFRARKSAPQRSNLKSWISRLRKKSRTSIAKSRQHYKQAFRRPLVEQLEARQLLTAVADVSPGELAGYQLLYAVDNNQFDFNDAYTVDNSGSIAPGSFDRVGYYVELGSNWVWASMDPFQTDPALVGVPKAGTGIVENGTLVTNLNVETDHPNVTPGTGLDGIIEFWASNYNPNGGGLFGSNDGLFDWKDSGGSTGGGHGSFQVFAFPGVPAAGNAQTVFGITANGGSGIGDQPSGHPDWTFGPGTGTYAIRNLEVWVKVNEAPVIGNLDGDLVSHPTGVVPTALDLNVDATAGDPDGALEGGSLTVSYQTGSEAADILRAGSNGASGAEAAVDVLGGTTIGHISNVVGERGTGGEDLVIQFDVPGNATPANVQALLRTIAFDDQASANAPSRVFDWTLDDGEGGMAAVSTSLAITGLGASVVTHVWDGNSDADGNGLDWNDGDNWDTGVVPDVNDIAVFNGIDPGAVDVGAGANFVGTVRFDAGDYNLQSGSGTGTLEASLVQQTAAAVAADNEISAQLQGAALVIDVDAGKLTLSNDSNPLIATTTANISGGELVAVLGDNGFALGDADINISNDGKLTVQGPPIVLPSVAGLQAWYDANDIDGDGIPGNNPVDGATVTDWFDKSGNLRHLISWTGTPTYETNEISGLPAVRFDANNENLQMAVANDYFAGDVYLVFRAGQDGGPPNRTTFGPDWGAPIGVKDGNDADRMWMLQGNEDRFWANELPSAVSRNGVAVSSANNFDMGGIDTSQYMVLQVAAGPNNGTQTREYIVGTRTDAWSNARFDTAEVVAFDHELIASERDAVAAYLGLKYNIGVAGSGGPNTTLNNDVTVTGSGTIQVIDLTTVSFDDLTMATSASLATDANRLATVEFRGEGSGVEIDGLGDLVRGDDGFGDDPDTHLNALNGTTLTLNNLRQTFADVVVNDTGNGAVVLPTDNPNNSASWFVGGGTFELQNDGALGTVPFPAVDAGTLLLSGVELANSNVILRGGSLTSNSTSSVETVDLEADSEIINTGGTLTISDINTIDDDPVDGGSSFEDTVPNGTAYNVTFSGAGDTTVTDAIGGGATVGTDSVVKDGSGTLRFEGDNEYAGLTTINVGTLVAAHNNALGLGGLIGSGRETVVNGATLRLENNVTITGEDVDLGSTFSSVGNNTLTGNILLTGDSDIQSDNGTLTINGTIDLNGFDLDLNPTDDGFIVVNGTIAGGAGDSIDHVGDGNTTLNGDNSSTYLGPINISNGTLIAGDSGALGNSAGQTTVTDGGTVGLAASVTTETFNISGTGATGRPGSLVNISGNNTLAGTGVNLVGNQAAIGSEAGLLTIANTLDFANADVVFDGDGDILISADIVGNVGPNLGNLAQFATGDYAFAVGGASSTTIDARIDNDGTDGWLLVGRGREGWQWNDAGMGPGPDFVNDDLGTPAAFTPYYFSSALINDIIGDVGLDLTDVEIRLKRAGDTTGSAYQEDRWRPISQTTWDWVFADPSRMDVVHEIVSGPFGTQGPHNANTHDEGGNNWQRIFTWAWGGHNNQQGFSFGSSVTNGGNGANDFLWEFTNENHAMPYTEVYIRSLVAPGANSLTKNGTGELKLTGDNGYAGETIVNEGTLVAGHDNALGLHANSTPNPGAGTTVNKGGTLALDNSMLVGDASGNVEIDAGESISIGGDGAAGQIGAIENIAGDNTINGDITLTGTTIASSSGLLTITGDIDLGDGNLTFAGAGDINVTGDIFGNIVPGGPPPVINGVTADLELWLDASDMDGDGNPGNEPANGDPVNTWVDKSSNGLNANLQLGDPSYTLNSTHGAPAVNFDGNDQLRTPNLQTVLNDADGSYTIISVARYTGAGGAARVITSDHNWLFGFHGGQTSRWYTEGWVNLDDPARGGGTDWHLHSGLMDGVPADPQGLFYRDGVLETDVNSGNGNANGRGGNNSFVNYAPRSLHLGSWNNNSEPSAAEISEILVYDRLLSEDERLLVESYLAEKYNLPGITILALPNNDVSKLGSGTVTLSGNNTFAGETSVEEGTLIAGSNTALGDPDGSTVTDTTVLDGATLGLQGNITIDRENFTINGTGTASHAGAIANISGDNTINDTGTPITAEIVSQGEIGIGSETAGGTLTIHPDIDLQYSKLTVDGDGDVIISGNILALVPPPLVPGLDTLAILGEGNHDFTADSQTFDAFVDEEGGEFWLLVGRGREGWAWNNAGLGPGPEFVNDDVGTPAAFAPYYFSTAIINDMIASTGLDLTDVEIRLKRATDQAGSAYQEDRWRPQTETSWRWNFDTAYNVTHEILAPGGPNGFQAAHNSNTRDEGPNDFRRIFTWAWGGHNNQRGFSFGSGASNGSNSATSFLWEFGNEQHAIPYTEVYIRLLNPPPPLVANNALMKMGGGTLTLAGANTYDAGTTVIGGTLLANTPSPDSATGGGDVVVESGATLGGTGNLTGNVTVNSGGHVAPGESPEILSTGSVSFNTDSTFDVEINGTTPGPDPDGHDQLNVTGTVNINGAKLILDGTGVSLPAQADEIVIVNNDGADPVVGEFTNSDGATIADGTPLILAGIGFEIDYQGGDGNDVVLRVLGIVEVDPLATTTASILLVGGPIGPVPVEHRLTGPALAHVFFEGPNEGDASDDGSVLGLDEVQTQLVSLDLTDADGFRLTLDPGRVSLGEIEELINNNPGRLDLDPFHPGDATSYFDVNFQIEVPGGLVLHNNDPLRIETIIKRKPPFDRYRHIIPQGGPIELFDENDNPTGVFLIDAEHYTGVIEVDHFDNTRAVLNLGHPDGSSERVSLTGPTTVNVYFEGANEGDALDDTGNNLDEVDTELAELNLTGNSSLGPVQLRLNPNLPSLGFIEESANSTPGTLDLPPFGTGTANSGFDVYFELEVAGQVFHTEVPKEMRALLNNKPPGAGTVYQSGELVIPLLDAAGNPTGFTLGAASHVTDVEFVEVDPLPITTASILLVGGPIGPVPVEHRLTGPAVAEVLFEGPNEGDALDNGSVLGLDEVTTELVSLDLTNTDGFRLTLNPNRFSFGEIEELINNNPGRLDLDPFHPGDATSYFDVNFQIEVPGGLVLHNNEPLRIETIIETKPPFARYRHIIPPSGPIELFDENDNPTGVFLIDAEHYTGAIEVDHFDNTRGVLNLGHPDGSSERVALTGPTTVNVYFEGDEGDALDDDGNNRDEVDTELVELNLTGNSSLGPVQLRLNPDLPSLGFIEETADITGGTLDVPPFTAGGAADSGFDVFFELEVAGQVFHTEVPKEMRALLNNKPPGAGTVYQSGELVIPLLDAAGNPTGFTLGAASHVTGVEFVEVDPLAITTASILLVGGPIGPVPVEHRLTGPALAEVLFEGPLEGDALDNGGVVGLDEVTTELVSLDLTNSDGFRLTLNPDRFSFGEIEELINNNPGRLDLDPFHPGDATSYFDVHFQIEVPGGQVLHNNDPLRIETIIKRKPPFERYRHIIPQGGPIELFDENDNPTGVFLIDAEHYTGEIEVDEFEFSLAEVELIPPVGPSETIQLGGPFTVDVFFEGAEGDALDDDNNGRDEVDTEIVSMDLIGSSSLGPVFVRLNPNMPSGGLIEESANNTPGTLDLDPFAPGSADSFFDVFFEIEIGGQVFHTDVPKHMSTVITEKPPGPNAVYEDQQIIPLLDAAGNPTGFSIGTTAHRPDPGLSSIHGYKFEDLDVNGIDDGEPRLEGVTITLTGTDDLGNSVGPLSVTTDANGEYWFQYLQPGTYTVTETPPLGSIPTTPASYTVALADRQELVALPGQAHIIHPNDPRVEVVIGPELAFGNAFEGSIHGFKFEDLNNDGIWQQGDEPPLAGVEITVTRTSSPPVIIDNGDPGFSAGGFTGLGAGYPVGQPQGYEDDIHYSGGNHGNTATWTFTNLEPGDYRVSATWNEHPNRATNAMFSIDNGPEIVLNQERKPRADVDVAGTNFQDLSASHAIAGSTLTVTLTDAGANDFVIADAIRIQRLPDVVATTATDDEGQYWFMGLEPGLTYLVTETPPPGSMQTTPNPPPITILSGQQYVATPEQAAGFTAGPITVEVYDGTSSNMASADAVRGSNTTGAPVNPKQNPGNDTIVLADIGSTGGGAYGGQNPVPAPGGGDSYAVFLTGFLDVDNTANPGDMWTFGSFTDDNSRIRIDLDGDGILEGSLTGVGGISGETVMYQGGCCGVVLGPQVNIPDGVYLFEAAFTEGGGGDYGEFFYAPGNPGFSTSNYALIGDNSKGMTTGRFVPHEGDGPVRPVIEPTLAFGNTYTGSIHGFKFEDLDADAQWDEGAEPAMAGISFELTGTDGMGNPVGPLVETTDDTGQFWFTDLKPGDYWVREMVELLPPDLMPSTPNKMFHVTIQSREEYVWRDGAAMLDPGDPRHEVVVGGDLAFGNFRNASIHGRKFEDLNGDGQHDEGEPYLNGWTVLLFDEAGNAVDSAVTMDMDLNDDGTIDPATESGWYWFTDLRPSHYTVGEVLPDEHWIQTTPMAPMGPVEPGFDLFMTDPGTTNVDLDLTPFGGQPTQVQLQGVPFAAGGADTIVERLAPANVDNIGDEDTVPIELVALQLQSVQPIDIGGELFVLDVFAGRDFGLPQQPGEMTIFREHQFGGSFDSELPVHARLVFTSQQNPSNVFEFTFDDVFLSESVWSTEATPGDPRIVSDGVPAFSGNGLMNVQVVNTIGPNPGNNTQNWLNVWNALDAGAGPTGIVAGYNVQFNTSDAEVNFDYPNSGGNFGVNHAIGTINNDGPGGGTGPFAPNAQSGSNYSIRAQTYLTFNSGGTFTIAMGSDDGRRIELTEATLGSAPGYSGFTSIAGQVNGAFTPGDTVFGFSGGTGHAQSIGTFSVAAGDTLALDAFYYEGGGGDSGEISIASGAQSGFNGSFQLIADGVQNITLSSTINGVYPSGNFFAGVDHSDICPGVKVLTEEEAMLAAHGVLPAMLQDAVAPGVNTVWLQSGEVIADVDFGNAVKGSIHGFKFEDLNGDGSRVVAAETIELRSGQDASGSPITPGVADANITYYSPGTTGPLTIDAAAFAAARTGPAAVAVAPNTAWILPSSFTDTDARWIHASHTPGGNGSGRPPASVLYAYPFTVSTTDIVSATLDFSWAADDQLGDNATLGVFVNEVPVNISGGGLGAATTALDKPVTVTPGLNWLYVYQQDVGAVVSGAMFSATIDVTTSEPPLAGVSFELTGTDGKGNPVGPIVETTDDTGEFWFTNLAPGHYWVREMTELLPADVMPSTPTDYHVTIASREEYVWREGAAMLGAADPRHEVVAGEELTFGNFHKGSIHGYKFEDVNVNGIDDGEPRLEGVQIHLDGTDGLGNVVQDWMETDANGEYWFSDLAPGTYTVSEVPPVGSVPTTLTSYDVIVHSGEALVALPGQAMLDPGDQRVEVVIGPELAFGNAFEGSIHGYKFDDQNGDGIWQQGVEPTLPGVKITVTAAATAGPVIIDNGDAGFTAGGFAGLGAGYSGPIQGYQDDIHYSAADAGSTATWTFTDLQPGDYRVSATWNIHANRATNSMFSIDGGVAIPVDQRLAPAADVVVSGTSFQDLSVSHSIAGSTLTVTLTDVGADGFVVADAIRIQRLPFTATTTTNANGEYWYMGLEPGLTYTIRETPPAGSTQTTIDPPPIFLESGFEWVATAQQEADLIADGIDPAKIVIEPTLAFGNRVVGEAEIELADLGNAGAVIADGSTVDLGSVSAGSITTREIQIRNTGGVDLNLDSISLAGDPQWTLDTSSTDTPVVPGGTTTFAVQLDASTGTDFNALVTVSSLNDDPISFNLTATVNSVLIIDNGDPGFSARKFTGLGAGFVGQPQGYQGDIHYHAPAAQGVAAATWTFSNLSPGTYNVAVTWNEHANRANDSSFTVAGTTNNGTNHVNQRLAPSSFAGSFEDDGVFWKPLTIGGSGGNFTLTGSVLTVRLATSVHGYVIADAVRIEKLQPLLADREAGGSHASAALLPAVGSQQAGRLLYGGAEFNGLIDQAAAQWSAVDASAAARLSSVTVLVADLPGDVLGLASASTDQIWLDVNAAGNGWLVSGERRAESGEPHAMFTPSPLHPVTPSSFDLLTVVSHELGHVLGLPDLDPVAHADDVMAGTLGAGVRRSPLGLGLSTVGTIAAAPRLSGPTDRLFSDLGNLGAMTVDEPDGPFDDTGHEPFGVVPTLQHRRSHVGAALRVEEDDTDWLATRSDEEQAIDEIFADLFDEGESEGL